MIIRVKRVDDTAVLPVRGSSHAAGYDLCAAIREELTVLPHTTVKVDTGLQMELPDGYFAGIFARSGIASREGLRPANCVGVCDSDYRGNYIVAIHNDSDVPRVIVPGNMLGYPMRNLNNSFRRFVGCADARKNFVFPVGGREIKVPDFRHGNFSSPVL